MIADEPGVLLRSGAARVEIGNWPEGAGRGDRVLAVCDNCSRYDSGHVLRYLTCGVRLAVMGRRPRRKGVVMAEMTGDAEVKEIARLVVSEVAPEELPVYSILAEATLADPARMLEGRDDIRERLGFGVGEVTLLVTPFAVLAAREVVQYLTKCTLDAGKNATTRIFRRRTQSPAEGSLHLSAEQLAELRRIVLEKALELGLKPKKAELLADAFAGRAGIG
jgi:hypothetical protein